MLLLGVDTLAHGADLAQIVLAACAAAGLLGATVGFSYKVWRKLELLDQKADDTHRQVTPNGGNTDSSGDRIVRIEDHLRVHIENDEAVQTEILRRLDAL
jgi:hypothetical protein